MFRKNTGFGRLYTQLGITEGEHVSDRSHDEMSKDGEDVRQEEEKKKEEVFARQQRAVVNEIASRIAEVDQKITEIVPPESETRLVINTGEEVRGEFDPIDTSIEIMNTLKLIREDLEVIRKNQHPDTPRELFVGIITGLTASTLYQRSPNYGSKIFELLRRYGKRKYLKSDIKLGDEKQSLNDLIKSVYDQDDNSYWTNFKVWARLNKLTLSDQFLLMGYSVEIFNCHEQFIWHSPQDKIDIANKLIEIYNINKKMEDVYAALAGNDPSLQYHGRPLPRGIAASLVRYTVAQVFSHLKPHIGPEMHDEKAEDSIPFRQLTPIIKVKSSMEPDYGDLYIKNTRINSYGIINEEIVESDENDINKLYSLMKPEQHKIIADSAVQLKQTIEENNLYPLPQGESFISSDIKILWEPIGQLNKGTVIYSRKSSGADMLFILPHVMFDTTALKLKIVGLNDHPVPEQPVPEKHHMSALSSVSTSAVLSIFSTLSFGFPPPWGVIGAAGLQLLSYLFEGDRSAYLQDMFNQLEHDFELFFQRQKIIDSEAAMSAFIQTLNVKLETLNNVATDNINFINETIEFLKKNIDENTVSSLNHTINLLNHPNYANLPGSYEMLVSAVGLKYLCYSVVLKLQILLANHEEKVNGITKNYEQLANDWLATHEEMRLYITNKDDTAITLDALTKISNSKLKERLSKITPVRRYEKVIGGGVDPSTSFPYDIKENGYGFSDGGVEKYWISDTRTGCCHQNAHHHKGAADQARDKYIKDAISDFNNGIYDSNHYSDILIALEKAKISFASLENIMPPRIPVDVITANVIDGDSKFKVGDMVSYKYQLKNDLGKSGFSPSSETVRISKDGQIILLTLPGDKLGLSDNCVIYRNINNSNTYELVAVLKKEEKTYKDDCRQNDMQLYRSCFFKSKKSDEEKDQSFSDEMKHVAKNIMSPQ